MVINFDEYKDGEPITIIEHGISKTYVDPKVLLSYNHCFPPTNNIFIEIIGEDVVWNGKHEYYNADYQKAMNFLDSLPQIESRLRKGGYIQDKNGAPCCDGDEVNFQYCDKYYKGTLTFDLISKCFTIVAENGDVFFWISSGIKWFEKVR